jgi:formylglycine-generating enzyme required for sulfatase activity
MKITKGRIITTLVVFFVILAGIYLVSNIFAEQVGSSPESGEKSRVMEMYDYLVGGGVGTDDSGSWGDWGSVMNRIRSVVEASISGPINCPTGMIPVPPGRGRPGFCVDKYEAKQSGSVAVSQASGTPWVSITQYDARAACIVAGKRLITNEDWLQIAQNVEQVGWNWSGGTPGSGQMSDGHSDNSPANSLAASTDDDPCSGTGQTCDTSTWNSQRRTYKLSNGEYIWDFGGNVWQWVDGFTYADYPYANNWSAWTACTTPDSICGNTLATNDQRYGGNTTALRALPRGGNWAYGTRAGAFTMHLCSVPSSTTAGLGFRCAW